MQLYTEREELISFPNVADTFVFIKLIKLGALAVDMVGASYFLYFLVFGWERCLVGQYKSMRMKRKREQRLKYYRETRFYNVRPGVLQAEEGEDEEDIRTPYCSQLYLQGTGGFRQDENSFSEE